MIIQQIEIKLYPEMPGYKEREGTSQQAAMEIAPKAATLRKRCYELLQKHELTADEIASLIEEDILSIRPRISELYKMGKIEKTGKKRLSSRGKSSAVWSELTRKQLLTTC